MVLKIWRRLKPTGDQLILTESALKSKDYRGLRGWKWGFEVYILGV